MKGKLFSGVATALLTPYKEGKVDYDTFETLINGQLDAGIEALVFTGTTGEAPTLSDAEKNDIYRFAKQTVGKRARVICGTSTNSHKKTMELSESALRAGADALLCVSPYYNRGTREGIERVYRDICSLGIPVILYNIPSRSGVDIGVEMLERLSDEDNLVGVKECAGAMRIQEEKLRLGDRYALYSGNDPELLMALSAGADGIVSVMSNLYPEQVNKVYKLFTEGRVEEARRVHFALSGLCSLLFSETNPAPLKYAASAIGLCENSLRLPLSVIRGELCRKIDKEIKKIEQNI